MNDFHQNWTLRPTEPPHDSGNENPTRVPDLIGKALDLDVVIFGESHQHLAMFREIDEHRAVQTQM